MLEMHLENMKSGHVMRENTFKLSSHVSNRDNSEAILWVLDIREFNSLLTFTDRECRCCIIACDIYIITKIYSSLTILLLQWHYMK